MADQSDSSGKTHAAQLRLRELTRDGIRHEDIPELRELAAKLYIKSAMNDLINPLFSALQKSSDPKEDDDGSDNESGQRQAPDDPQR